MTKRLNKRRLIGFALSLCICLGSVGAFAADGKTEVFANMLSEVDFSDSSWSGFNGSGTVNQTDKTKIEITKNDGANISLKSGSEGFVTNLNGAEKYLQYDAATGVGTNLITVSPSAALTEDFSFEFKAAGKKVTGTNVRYMSIVMIPEGAQNHVEGTTVFGWNNSYMYDVGSGGNGSRWPNNTENLALIIPNWSTTQKYAIGYSETDLRSYKIDVHFNEGGVPTFDLWGVYATGTGLEEDEDGRQLLLKGVKFAEKDGLGTSTVDYSKGIGSIRIEMGSTSTNESIAIADMKLKSAADSTDMDFDFESAAYSKIFEQSANPGTKTKNTLKWGNGMSLAMNSDADVKITDNGFVKNNAAGNKYLQVISQTGNSNEASGDLTLSFPVAMKEDFVIEFKLAVDMPYTPDGADGFWGVNAASLFFGENIPGGNWTTASRPFFFLGNDRYGVPKDTESTYASCQWGSDAGGQYISNGRFETIRVITKYNATRPTVDVYRKAADRDFWELISKDIPLTKLVYNTENSIDYSNGIASISLNFWDGYNASNAGKDAKYAIDDLCVYPLGSDEVFVDTFEMTNNGENYTANVKIINKTADATAYRLIICTYDKNGKLIAADSATLAATAGKAAENNTLSISTTDSAYAKLYLIGADGTVKAVQRAY